MAHIIPISTTPGKGVVFTTFDFQKSRIEIIQLPDKISPDFLGFYNKLRKMG